MELVEGHDGAEEEEGEVEVVLEQVQEGVAALLAVAVLQCEAHAAHDGEAAAAVEQHVLQVEGACHQRFLRDRRTAWECVSGGIHNGNSPQSDFITGIEIIRRDVLASLNFN